MPQQRGDKSTRRFVTVGRNRYLADMRFVEVADKTACHYLRVADKPLSKTCLMSVMAMYRQLDVNRQNRE